MSLLSLVTKNDKVINKVCRAVVTVFQSCQAGCPEKTEDRHVNCPQSPGDKSEVDGLECWPYKCANLNVIKS